MSDEATPLVPAGHGGLGHRIVMRCVGVAVRASLLVSPRPAALLVRRVFASGGAKTAAALEKHAPAGVAITSAQLRGLVLACGPYDLALAREASSPAGQRFVEIVLWAYSGKRQYLDDPAFAAWSVADFVTPTYPPALVTVGNADPLRQHSERLAEKLRALGVETETVFYPADYEPPLGHEYQFDLDTDAGQRFLEHLLAFLRQRLGSPSAAYDPTVPVEP